jgi:hypothetical protein
VEGWASSSGCVFDDLVEFPVQAGQEELAGFILTEGSQAESTVSQLLADPTPGIVL